MLCWAQSEVGYHGEEESVCPAKNVTQIYWSCRISTDWTVLAVVEEKQILQQTVLYNVLFSTVQVFHSLKVILHEFSFLF
jgi:hypothetical protein